MATNSFEIKKQDKCFLVEEFEPINELLKETLKSSQRIKLVCYDISQHYVVFGANNGSIHIYRRGHNSVFSKLIPSKNSASIDLVSISPHEENILVSDETGSILILEKCFIEQNFYSHVYSESKGKKITALKWENESKVYIGDNTGGVSVLSVPNLVSLPLLHTPYVSLMELTGEIIQIDIFSHFMLITTERKIYICDTEREMYKQVGRRDKGKALGACFYNTFQGKISEVQQYENCRIYCTRPGLRIWQANFEGEVSYTHKYKNVLPSINELLKWEKDYANLKTENIVTPEAESTHFGRIHVFKNEYICVVSSTSFYIINPENNELVIYYHISESSDIRLVENKIYIWKPTGDFQVLSLFSLEELICDIIKHKNYRALTQLTLRYKEDIINWSKYSPNVNLLIDLKMDETNLENDLINKFNEVVKAIIADEKKRLDEFIKEDDPKIKNMENGDSSSSDSDDDIRMELQVMGMQHSLNEGNKLILMPQFTNILSALDENESCQLFLDFIDYMKESNQKINMEWCYSQYLYHFHMNRGYAKLKKLNSQTLNFVKKSFLEINKEMETACSCNFPFPCLNKVQPKYDQIGKALSEFSDDFKFLFGKIPHLWFHHIRKFKNIKQMEENLPLILQFGYVEILNRVRKYVSYDFCDNLVNLFIKLKAGNCLNCGKPFPDENCKQIPDWDYIGLTLIPFIGADNVLKLFLNHHEHIPKEELSERFYLSCMFSNVENNNPENSENSRSRTVELASNFLSNSNTSSKFINSLQVFLMGKNDKSITEQCLLKKNTCSRCSYCEVLLNHPVLNEIEQLDCGHTFHSLCLIFIGRVCNICFSS